MIVASLLVISALITLARGSPMSYATYRRRELPADERPELLLLYDQRGLENTDPPLRSANDIDRDNAMELPLQDEMMDMDSVHGSSMARSKKLRMSRTSLSIVNPLDVLRDRVMLELARRKAMQDQRQIDANRRLLQEIGKRSVQQIDPSYPRTSGPSHSLNNRVYTSDRQSENQEQSHNPYTQRIPVDAAREWYNVNDAVIRGSSSSISNSNSNSSNGDDETRKVLSNYHHDRM